jgi:hypothetical protein
MFAPTEDRGGAGFTRRSGDIVTISSARLGALVNRVAPSDTLPRWDGAACCAEPGGGAKEAPAPAASEAVRSRGPKSRGATRKIAKACRM